MKRLRIIGLLLFIVGLLFITTIATAQTTLKAGIDFPAEIENPEILGINKEPFHATLMPYANLQEALTAKRNASSFYRSLNGKWKFNWVKSPELRPKDFYKRSEERRVGKECRSRWSP